jgi:transposase
MIEDTENSYKISADMQSVFMAMQMQTDKISDLEHENDTLKKKNEWLMQQFNLSRQREFGRSTEKSAANQITLFDEKMDDAGEEAELPAEQETITYTRPKAKKTKGRNIDLSRFPQEQVIYDLTAAEKICSCGGCLEIAGEDTSTQVDHIPETFRVIEHVTLKYCCRPCGIMRQAKKPETAIPKCMASAGFVAEVIVKKYEQHLPLYRQSKIFERAGAVIPDNTLGNWVMRSAEVLEPLRVASKAQISAVRVMQADETKVQTLKPSRQGYLWGYHSCDMGNRFVIFEFASGRGAVFPNAVLKDFSGILQTDGYSGYNDLRKKEGVISLGCWDHVRRKFVDVVKTLDKERTGRAAKLLIPINQLYAIEREAKEMDPDQRRLYREERSSPVLAAIKADFETINAPPKSLLGQAVIHIKNQWPYLTEYIHHGAVPISNVWMENHIRPFALGRKNWLFTGTPESANKAALLYSLILTCRMNGVDPRKYLEYVLNQANAMRRKEISATLLLPQFIDKTLLK